MIKGLPTSMRPESSDHFTCGVSWQSTCSHSGDIFSNRQHQIVVTSTRWNGSDHVESQGLTGRIKRFSSLELRKSIAEYLNMAPVMPQRETSDSLRRQIDELRIEAARLLSESEKTKRAARN